MLEWILTGSRSKQAYASLDACNPQQTLFLIFLVVHDLVVCFMQNRLLNSAALMGFGSELLPRSQGQNCPQGLTVL